ncbi:MAG: hypothetical protein KF901_14485 [Myxococcales bacterium]|nr:hypothetical protein [Myxococcales bacterium]
MSRALVPVVVAFLALVLGAWAVFAWIEHRDEQARVAAEETRQARQARAEQRRAERAEAIADESTRFVPDALGGVRLGMSLQELRSARPAATPPLRVTAGETRWEEELANRAKVVYGFGASGERLAMIQVLSQIPPEGVGPHLAAMQDRYGPATVVMRCSAQSAAGVPTLRFLWQGASVTLQDVLLIHEGGVSLTLYVTSNEATAASLRAGGCAPVRSRDELEELQIATPEMLRER